MDFTDWSGHKAIAREALKMQAEGEKLGISWLSKGEERVAAVGGLSVLTFRSPRCPSTGPTEVVGIGLALHIRAAGTCVPRSGHKSHRRCDHETHRRGHSCGCRRREPTQNAQHPRKHVQARPGHVPDVFHPQRRSSKMETQHTSSGADRLDFQRNLRQTYSGSNVSL